MSLSTRSLGPQGLTVSALGLGRWGMSAVYGPTDDSESLATLERALDLGVTLLDTLSSADLERLEAAAPRSAWAGDRAAFAACRETRTPG